MLSQTWCFSAALQTQHGEIPLTNIKVSGSLAGLMHGFTILEQEASTSRQGYDAGIKLGPTILSFMKNHNRVNREYKIDSVSPVIYSTQMGKRNLRTNNPPLPQVGDGLAVYCVRTSAVLRQQRFQRLQNKKRKMVKSNIGTERD